MIFPRPLILIPSYNTGPILLETVTAAVALRTPVWVIFDGTDDGSPELIADLVSTDGEHLRVLQLKVNSGKGAAVMYALREALLAGFSHVLTMDADGQHPAGKVAEFFKWSAAHPEAAVFGRPIFDASAPALRVNGRKVSNFWANLDYHLTYYEFYPFEIFFLALLAILEFLSNKQAKLYLQ